MEFEIFKILKTYELQSNWKLPTNFLYIFLGVLKTFRKYQKIFFTLKTKCNISGEKLQTCTLWLKPPGQQKRQLTVGVYNRQYTVTHINYTVPTIRSMHTIFCLFSVKFFFFLIYNFSNTWFDKLIHVGSYLIEIIIPLVSSGIKLSLFLQVIKHSIYKQAWPGLKGVMPSILSIFGQKLIESTFFFWRHE